MAKYNVYRKDGDLIEKMVEFDGLFEAEMFAHNGNKYAKEDEFYFVICSEKTINQYMFLFGEEYKNGELWDFPMEELTNGAVEPEYEGIYYQIGDRIYETSL